MDLGTHFPSQLYEKWSKAELEYQYSPSRWSPRKCDDIVADHVAVMNRDSLDARNSMQCQLAVQYGPTERQKLNILCPPSLPKDAPILIYIHGGYWQLDLLSRDSSTFMGIPFVARGAAVVAVGYDLAPTAGMETIVSQVLAAIKHVLQWAFNRNSSGVYLSGHSAGGHLAAMALSVDWNKEVPRAAHLLKGACLISGIYDVRPLVKTDINDPIKMSPEVAWEQSPFKHVKDAVRLSGHVKVILAVGQHESPEFKRQSREYEQVLRAGGVSTKLVEVPDVDHFNVVERLSEADYELTLAVMEMMDLK